MALAIRRYRLPRFRVRAISLAFLLTSILLATWPPAPARSTALINLTLWNPLSTQADLDAAAHLRLALIYGRLGSIHGADATGLVSWLHGDMNGVQFVGAYSQINGRVRGVTIVPGVAYVQGPVSGAQYAGLANFNRSRVTGLQIAGLLNFTTRGISGVQAATFVNLNDGGGGGVQLAGVANTLAADFKGVQLAIANTTNADLGGVQAGTVNLARGVDGLQLGLINIAEAAEGVQIGLFNLANRQEGIPIGLVNIAPETEDSGWSLLAYTSNISAYGVGLRTDVRHWRSEITVGYNDRKGDVENTLFLGWNFGYAFQLSRRWSLIPDFGIVHLIPEKTDDPELNDKRQFAVNLRLRIEYRFGDHLAVYAGVGSNATQTDPDTDAEPRNDGLAVLGFAVF